MVAIDQDYIVKIRRELHEYPEIGFDLERTVNLVKRELDEMGISYTERFGRSSVVATLGPENAPLTIGIRADMDALPIQEKCDLPFRSKIDGNMHACGHDAHTAMLLGTAKALLALKEKLCCRVKFLFQPSEEGARSGAEEMVKDGVMDDIDFVLGVHVENWLESGRIGVCSGDSMASSRTFAVEFFGKTAHATLPHTGCDALAAAVKAYNGIDSMLHREIDPFAKKVCHIGKLTAGTTQNVVADYAEMRGTIRTYEAELDAKIIRRIEEIAKLSAEEVGCTAKVTSHLKAFPLYNNPYLSGLVLASAEKALGKEFVQEMPIKMSSEDFSWYLTKKPGVFMRLGTRNEKKGCVTLPHNNDFLIDEDALSHGSAACVQFVLDHMAGVDMEKVYAAAKK